MEQTLKEQIQDTVSKISRDAKALCGPAANRKIGELIALVRALPEPYERNKLECTLDLDFEDLEVRVFFDHQPEEKPILYSDNAHPGCPEDVTVNHAEFLNLRQLDQHVLDRIRDLREDGSLDFYYDIIGRK